MRAQIPRPHLWRAAALANIAFAAALALVSIPPKPVAPMLPPVGMLIFCLSQVTQCLPSTVASVAMNEKLVATLKLVNSRVNHTIRPRNDSGRDTWSINVPNGDCEDYALTKRAMLIHRGIPAGALRIATTTYQGEGHAILVVKTDAGDYVLDNIEADVRDLTSSGYQIQMISTPNPHVWTTS